MDGWALFPEVARRAMIHKVKVKIPKQMPQYNAFQISILMAFVPLNEKINWDQ